MIMDYIKISPPSPLPISFTGHQKTILNEQSKFGWRWQLKHEGPKSDPTRHIEIISEVTLEMLRSFGAILGPFEIIWGQFVAPKSKFLQTSHVTL